MQHHLGILSQVLIEGNSHSRINSYRSALNLLFTLNETDQRIINRFIKGVSYIRSSKPKYVKTWHPSSILELLQKWHSLESLSLEKLTKELVTLIAITSASRAQTISLIKIDNTINLSGKIEIKSQTELRHLLLINFNRY